MKKLIIILFSFTLFWSQTIIADELDSELIKELKTFYVDSCKGDLMDAFEASGSGFGKTFDFKYFPFRIDFILADQSFIPVNFKNYRIPYSDHFPIRSEFSLNP